MKRSKKLTTLMAALSVFALTGCDLTNLGLGSLTKPFENFSILDLVDPLEWFHDKKEKEGEGDKKDDTVAVTSVTLSAASISLKVNQEKTLTATVLPENATNKAVTWASTDAQVASVTDGKVKGLKAGTAKIKATAGGKTAECSVVVTEASGDDDSDEIVEITKVNAPETIEQNGTLATTQVTLEVELADGSVKNDVHPEEIVLDTSKLGEVEGTVKIAGLSATFTIEVVTGQVVPPVTDIITPQQAMALMDAAGEEVVVPGTRKVKGVVAANSKYDSKYDQWTTGFDGVDNFKLQFKDPNNILNGGSPDGMEVVVEGYLEKFQGKYQLSYLPASASPSGQAETPVLVSAQQIVHEAALDSITVSNNHREFFVGGTFVGETVTAHYVDGTTATVTGTFTGYNLANEGTQTVTVSYTEKGVTKTTTYQITVSPKADIGYGTESAPLTVTQALQVITQECTSDSSMTAQAITVQGTIAEVKKEYTYDSGPCFEFDITDGTSTVYVYRCHCTEAQKSGVVAGATVKLVGYAKNFKGTLEFVDNGSSQCHILSVGSDTPPVNKEVVSIEIIGSLTKTTYTEGQQYSAAGLSVKAHYDDGTEAQVSCTITLNKTTAALGDTQIIASASLDGINAAPVTFNVTVNEKVPVVGGSVYTFTNDKTETQNISTWDAAKFLQHVTVDGGEIITGFSNATNAYIGANGGSGETAWNIWNSLKIGKSSAKGEVTLLLDQTANFTSVKVWAIGNRDDGTLSINDITKDVTKKASGSNVEPMELEYEISGGITELNLSTKDYSSSNYSITITKIEFVGEAVPAKEVKSISIEGSLAKTNYIAGEAYSKEGLSVKAHYDDDTEAIVTAEITLNKETAAVGDTMITASASYGGKDASKEFAVSVEAAPEITSISIEGTLAKTQYSVGETYSSEGLSVVAHYANGLSGAISTTIGFDKTTASSGDTQIVATASFGGIDAAPVTYNVTVVTQKTPVTISSTIESIATTNGWTNETQYPSFVLDSVITVSCSGTENTGKFYTSDKSWRIYANESGQVTISAAEGYTIQKATITFTVKDNGILTVGGKTIDSGAENVVNSKTATFAAGSSSQNKGKVLIKEISVVYIAD